MKKILFRLLFLLLLLSLILLYVAPPWMPEALESASSFVQSAAGGIREWISPTPEAPVRQYEVIRVIDGDTLLVRIEGEEVSVRLIGVDAPESVHPDESRNTPEGTVASDWMKNYMADRRQVALEYDEELLDHFGRTLAYVYVGDTLLEDELLRAGMAVTLVMEPNTRYQLHFAEVEREAKASAAGFWGTGFFR
ncbi:MAG: thermonuclease family protein [Oscillospiraceae bacterium]|nr:thermonuclease family protein [Oscillospiraceae bacterium]